MRCIRELVENFKNRDISPVIVTQTKVTYNSNTGENFTRMGSEYHELIGEGYCNATQDHSTPNFTAMGATCHNKFKGNVGMAAERCKRQSKENIIRIAWSWESVKTWSEKCYTSCTKAWTVTYTGDLNSDKKSKIQKKFESMGGVQNAGKVIPIPSDFDIKTLQRYLFAKF